MSAELGVQPIMIDAALVSAQDRKRYFWTNIPNVTQPEDKGILVRDVIETPYNVTLEYRNRTKERWRVKRGGKVQTLRSAMGTGGNNVPLVVHKNVYLSDITKDNAQQLFDNNLLRKITPVECERLQSLPDGYTEGVSNTQRYKSLGNAFNMEVVKHILSHAEI